MPTFTGGDDTDDRDELQRLLTQARDARANLPARGTHPGELAEIRIPIPDRPGAAAEVFTLAAELGVNIASFEVVHMETPTHLNPLGAKGIGESGTIGSTTAVQSAVIDAVSHLGVRHIDMPTTAERVWKAIADARG